MAKKTRIDIALLLPNLPDTADACIDRLRALLQAKEGVAAAHLLEEEVDRPDRICIHFDPDRLSLGDVRELARRAGVKLEARFGHLLRKSQPMHARQARTRCDRLQQVGGVLEAAISPDGVVRIEFDRDQIQENEVLAAASGLGLRLIDTEVRDKPEAAEAERREGGKEGHEHGGVLGKGSRLQAGIG